MIGFSRLKKGLDSDYSKASRALATARGRPQVEYRGSGDERLHVDGLSGGR
jgi:hypothetical protein